MTSVPMEKRKQRNYRKRTLEDTQEGEDEVEDLKATRASLDEAKLEAKMRKREGGVTPEDLLKSEQIVKPTLNMIQEEDPYKLKTGGLVEMKKDKVSSLSNSFTVQSNALDVDKHMLAYIEAEMKKKKGVQDSAKSSKTLDPMSELYQIPDHLVVPEKKVEEGSVTISSGMLNAIPEVDLGIDSKLKNIMETEKAKQKMFEQLPLRKQETAIDKKRFRSTATQADKEPLASDDALAERFKRNFRENHGRR